MATNAHIPVRSARRCILRSAVSKFFFATAAAIATSSALAFFGALQASPEVAGATRPAGTEAEGERHHSALREPAEHDPPVCEGVEPLGGLGVGRSERRRVRIADTGHDIPMVPRPPRERERRAGRHDVPAALGISQ